MGVDRSNLVSLIDQLVSVKGTDMFPADADRPALIVEGVGGSGRSTFLHAIWARHAGRTPTAWVDPRLLGDVPDDQRDRDNPARRPGKSRLRPVLLAVMLGLSGDVPGYKVKFPRVITAYIAMKDPIEDDANPKLTMRKRLIAHKDRNNLIGFVGSLVRIAGQAVQGTHGTGGQVVAAIGDEMAPRIAERLRRSATLEQLLRGEAGSWFGHQDIGRNWEPIEALVLLNSQAQMDSDAMRREVDDLLVRALLADLRESLSDVANRPSNPLVLLDNGDMPMARAFTSALVRTRRRDFDLLVGPQTPPPDPLVMVTTSSGALASDLAGPATSTIGREGSPRDGGTVPDVRWMPVRLGDFTEEDVKSMADRRMWASQRGTGTVAYLVHRLTGGHAEATSLVLKTLDTDPPRIADLGAVLRSAELTPQVTEGRQRDTVGRHLLNKIVAGLRPSGRVDRWLMDDLVTLCAARDADEAESLAELLRPPNQQILLNSTTLWSGRSWALPPVTPPAPAPSVMPPLIRYLSLLSLASRDGASTPSWETVFGTLREAAISRGDRTGRLYHELALGDTSSVIAELVGLLSEMRGEDWLALLDDVTSMPDPRTVFIVQDNSPTENNYEDVVARIVEGQRASRDPQLSDHAKLSDLYQGLSNEFSHLYFSCRSPAFRERTKYYGHLAERLV